MQRSCLKCNYVNDESTGKALEPCPQCGAIYSKVEAAMAQRQIEANISADAQPLPAVVSKAADKQPGGGTTIGTGSGLLLIALVSTLGIWAKMGESTNQQVVPPDGQRVQALEAAAKAQRNAVQLAIKEGRVLIGMTADQVHESWGRPASVNRTESAYGSSEQWVYGGGRYAYLHNDVVKSIQTSKK